MFHNHLTFNIYMIFGCCYFIIIIMLSLYFHMHSTFTQLIIEFVIFYISKTFSWNYFLSLNSLILYHIFKIICNTIVFYFQLLNHEIIFHDMKKNFMFHFIYRYKLKLSFILQIMDMGNRNLQKKKFHDWIL